MNELVCNYAVVRFLPYRETGEFVNIGVVACCPEINFFDFRLLEKRRRRIRQFFPELDEKVYQSAVATMKQELQRHRNSDDLFSQRAAAKQNRVSEALKAFTTLTRHRESLLHFTEPRMKVVTDEPEVALKDLYAHFVDRAFAKQPDYQETVMRRRLRSWLKDWKLNKVYKSDQKIGDADFHITIPFVRFEQKTPVSAIKPFDLNRPEPTEVYLHGDAWVQRIRRLKTNGQLPNQMIFAVQWPADSKPRAAAQEIVRELKNANAKVVDFDEDQVHEQIKL